MALDSASQYESFLDEVYEHLNDMKHDDALLFIQDLDLLLRIEFCLMLCERHFRLGSSRDKSSHLLQRVLTIFTNLDGVKVENRSGVSRNFDPFLFRIVRILIFTLVKFYRFETGDRSVSLPSPPFASINQVMNVILTEVENIPRDISTILRDCCCMLERHTPQLRKENSTVSL